MRVRSQKTAGSLFRDYRLEIDVSDELDEEEASYFQSLIRVLRWMVDLGRVDICPEVSMLSSHVALPKRGHLDALFHLFAYLKIHHNSEIVFDLSEPDLGMADFLKEDWSLPILQQSHLRIRVLLKTQNQEGKDSTS